MPSIYQSEARKKQVVAQRKLNQKNSARKKRLKGEGSQEARQTKNLTQSSRLETNALEDKAKRNSRIKRYRTGGAGHSGTKRSFYTPMEVS